MTSWKQHLSLVERRPILSSVAPWRSMWWTNQKQTILFFMLWSILLPISGDKAYSSSHSCTVTSVSLLFGLTYHNHLPEPSHFSMLCIVLLRLEPHYLQAPLRNIAIFFSEISIAMNSINIRCYKNPVSTDLWFCICYWLPLAKHWPYVTHKGY